MKKQILSLMLISLMVANNCFANQAVNIDKDQKAPFSGVLFDKEKANNVKNELIEKDSLVKTNESLNKSINLYRSNQDLVNKENDLLLNQNVKLTENLNSAREMSDIAKIGYFLLGVAVTGAAVYGASRLAK
jgi:hypothetical protein